MKKSIAVIVLVSSVFLLSECAGNKENSGVHETSHEMEEIQSKLEELSEAIEAETEAMNHDVDSLLEGM